MALAWLHLAQAWAILGQGQSQEKQGPGQSQWLEPWLRQENIAMSWSQYMPTEKVFTGINKPWLVAWLGLRNLKLEARETLTKYFQMNWAVNLNRTVNSMYSSQWFRIDHFDSLATFRPSSKRDCNSAQLAVLPD
ncbi:hypothetical protein DFH09DRAFT_1112669 [Mycena vulgaris]|nr:hypothetical protein DFH09DRAFT_1112669 [Mycena vulgaris]